MINILKSRTAWTIFGLFLFNGLQAVAPMVSGTLSVVINVMVTALALYFRAYPAAPAL